MAHHQNLSQACLLACLQYHVKGSFIQGAAGVE